MAYGYSYGPPGEHQKAKEAEASSMDGEPRGFFCACLDNHAIIGDGDDDIYIMMKCLFVTKNHHFLL